MKHKKRRNPPPSLFENFRRTGSRHDAATAISPRLVLGGAAHSKTKVKLNIVPILCAVRSNHHPSPVVQYMPRSMSHKWGKKTLFLHIKNMFKLKSRRRCDLLLRMWCPWVINRMTKLEIM